MASKILVVDDDPNILRFVKYMLVQEGYEVLTASNGIDGLQMALEHVPDLAVLDVMLPGLDGFEVCHRLRNRPSTAQISVLMISAKGQPIDKDTGLKVGADEYLVKPINQKEFLVIVERLLAQKEQASQKRARTIAFIGSRGGVGTSTVVTSVSVVLAEMGYPPIFVDLNPSLGIVPSLMGLEPQGTIARLFERSLDKLNRDELESALTKHPSGVRLLSGEQAPEEYGRVTPTGIEMLMRELSVMADYILIDMPSSLSEVNGVALTTCDFVNLVISPEHASLTKINSAVTLLSKLGIGHRRLGIVVVDRAGIGINTEFSTSTLIDNLPVIGIIPFDAKACAGAEERRIPVVLDAPHSSLTSALRELAEKLLSLEQLAPSGNTSSEGS